jgi:hypothetical protein
MATFDGAGISGPSDPGQHAVAEHATGHPTDTDWPPGLP